MFWRRFRLLNYNLHFNVVTFLSQLMTEILFGIRVIKFYTWEPHFTQKVADCRKQELAHLKALKYLDAVCVYTWAALPVVISILTFITYVLLGHQLTAAKVGNLSNHEKVLVKSVADCCYEQGQTIQRSNVLYKN